MRQHKIGIWILVLIIAFLLAVTSQTFAFRFVVLADSPDNQTNQAGFNQNALEYIRRSYPPLKSQAGSGLLSGRPGDQGPQFGRRSFSSAMASRHEPPRPGAHQGFCGRREPGPVWGHGADGKVFGSGISDLLLQSPLRYAGTLGPPSYKYLAYSLSYENAFFVVLDTFGFYRDGDNPDGSPNWVNWDNGLDAEQLGWFASQADQATEKYKFVLSHGPALFP